MFTKTKTIGKQLILSGAVVFSSNAIAQTGLLDLVTQSSGLYRLTYEQLRDNGIDLAGVDSSSLAITHAGDSVFRHVGGESDGSFNVGSYIDFVAKDVDNRYTGEAVYTLHLDEGKVVEIPVDVVSGQFSGSGNTLGSIKSVKNDNINYGFTSANLSDPWSMAYIYANGSAAAKSFSIDLPHLSVQSGSVDVSVTVSGASSLKERIDHSVSVAFNGASIGERQFDGFVMQTISGSVRASGASSAANTVEITLPMDHAAPYDVVSIESITVGYERDLVADNNDLTFASNANALTVSGIESPEDTLIYQHTATGEVRLLTARADQSSQGDYQLTFATGGFEADYYVYDSQGAPAPQLRTLAEAADIQSGCAEYLVITHADFIGSQLDRLVQLRSANYSVKVVDVEQIYQQFGRHTAEAAPIKSYIQYAVENLNTKMVVLMGGDTYDYRNFKTDSVSHIPTPYKVISGGSAVITHAPSDASYGDLDEDGVPDVAVGRFPVRTVAELEIMMNKIEQYEQREYTKTSVFAADQIDNGKGYSFVDDAESIVGQLPADVQANNRKAYIELDGAEAAKSKLIDAINEGTELTAYLGHSNMFKWSTDLLDTNDAEALTNYGKPTVMAQYGCWNTYYVLPEGNSMAQVLLLSGEQGAATVLGSSTLTLASSETALGEALFAEMYIPGKTLGEALVAAKQAIANGSVNADVLLGWQIMGDPAIVMNRQ